MMYLIQGQENTPFLLTFQAVGSANVNSNLDEGGRLVDAYEVKFQIRDPTGTDVFPGSGGYEVVTGTDGELGTGRYYAYDDAFSIGWTPSATALLGVYEIEWRWTEDAGGTERRWVQKFRVESSSKFSGMNYAAYISPGEIRDSIAESELSDARLEKLISTSQQYIERITRNVFRPVYMEFVFNGQNHETMFFSSPIIGIEDVFANGGSTALTPSSYVIAHERVDQLHVYTPNPDRRRNPSIRMRSGRTSESFFSRAGTGGRFGTGGSRFHGGAGNQMVRGVFGFLEADGSCPALITDAMLRLVTLNTPKIETGNAANSLGGPISSETVDRHSISYSVSKTAQATTKWALAGSKEVEEILAMYKAPIAIRASSTQSTRPE